MSAITDDILWQRISGAVEEVHVQDLISVGLIDASWLTRLPPHLVPRLEQLLANPGRLTVRGGATGR